MPTRKIQKISEKMSFYPPKFTNEDWEKLDDEKFIMPRKWSDGMKYLSDETYITLVFIAVFYFSKNLWFKAIELDEIYNYTKNTGSTIESLKNACYELIDKKFIYPEMVKF